MRCSQNLIFSVDRNLRAEALMKPSVHQDPLKVSQDTLDTLNFALHFMIIINVHGKFRQVWTTFVLVDKTNFAIFSSFTSKRSGARAR